MTVSNHKTVRLVIELMSQGRPKSSCLPREAPAAGEGISRSFSRAKNLSDSALYKHAQNLRCSWWNASSSSTTNERPFTEESFPTTSTSWDDEGRNLPWDDSSEDSEGDELDRSRAHATAQLPEDTVPSDTSSGSSEGVHQDQVPERLQSIAPSILDEMDHPALTGAVGALHGYTASQGDTALLEKAYDLARSVAGRKHDVAVAFDTCRIALAAGYVHSLKRDAPDTARSLVLHHSLPRLARSVERYWSGYDDLDSSEREHDWEQCMLSLLEVVSSVSLMTETPNVLSVLDAKVGTAVAEAIGLYCERNPPVLLEYPMIGNECLRRHREAMDIIQHRPGREFAAVVR